MAEESKNDRLLNRIIAYGLSLSFSVLLASLEALRATNSGFTFEVTWRTLVALVLAAAVVAPCFQIIVYSQNKGARRAALIVVVLIGIGSFFYPLRFVPREKMGAIFTGLGLAVVALSSVGGFLLLVRRFFEGGSDKSSP
jgi:hypothetical protein